MSYSVSFVTQRFNKFCSFMRISFLLKTDIKFCRRDEISPKLGRGIDEAVLLAKEHAVQGVIQIIVIISADGTSRSCKLFSDYSWSNEIKKIPIIDWWFFFTSTILFSDDAMQSAERVRDQYGYGIVTISVRAPSSELLKKLSFGSSTKFVLYFNLTNSYHFLISFH